MGIIQRIRSALTPPAPPAIIAKPSQQASELAALINSGTSLDPGAKLEADRVRAEMAALTDPYPGDYGGYATVGAHATAATSRDPNLALLQTLVRWRRAGTVLEIGTAYGVSGIALTMAGARLTTVEGFEPQATLGPRNIASAGIEAECIGATKEEAIPCLVAEGRRFDMVFHDGGHLGDAYVDDFAAIAPMLNPGAVFVIDNIFHDDNPKRREWSRTLSQRTCREGWEELVGSSAVEGALVYRSSVGILLTRALLQSNV